MSQDCLIRRGRLSVSRSGRQPDDHQNYLNQRFKTCQVLVAIVRKRLNLDLSLHAMLQILSATPFEKVPVIQLLTDIALGGENPDVDNQLILL